MSTHSPGPWEFDETYYTIYRGGGDDRTQVAAFSDSSLPTLADGRLMAAAPDLLEACELLLSLVYCNGVWCGFPCCNTCHSIEQAKSAIKKAKGEQ